MPQRLESCSNPRARAKSPLPSARRRTLSPTSRTLPQASITKTSLTAVPTIRSTPFFRMSSARSTKPGRWWSEQVGVKAPGTPKSTTFLPANTSRVEMGRGPSAAMVCRVTSGILSPTPIAILASWSRVLVPRTVPRAARILQCSGSSPLWIAGSNASFRGCTDGRGSGAASRRLELGDFLRALGSGAHLLHGRVVEDLSAGAVRPRAPVLPPLRRHLDPALAPVDGRHRDPDRRAGGGRPDVPGFPGTRGRDRPGRRPDRRHLRSPAGGTAL